MNCSSFHSCCGHSRSAKFFFVVHRRPWALVMHCWQFLAAQLKEFKHWFYCRIFQAYSVAGRRQSRRSAASGGTVSTFGPWPRWELWNYCFYLFVVFGERLYYFNGIQRNWNHFELYHIFNEPNVERTHVMTTRLQYRHNAKYGWSWPPKQLVVMHPEICRSVGRIVLSSAIDDNETLLWLMNLEESFPYFIY